MGPLIGEGGFGKVYKVLHKQTGIARALKVIKRSTLNQENEA
jgi:calcium-dependent protein kinase